MSSVAGSTIAHVLTSTTRERAQQLTIEIKVSRVDPVGLVHLWPVSA